jgi:hypothetical protein
VYGVEERFVFLYQRDAVGQVVVPFHETQCGVEGEWMMDVFGEVGLEMWSEKDTVSRRVMIRIVVIVARGRIMNFIDWYCG